MGRPKGTGHPKMKHGQASSLPKLITPEQAKKIVNKLNDKGWTYSEFAEFINKKEPEAMQIMNELLHYGLMKVSGKKNKKPVFEKVVDDEEW